MVIRVPPRYSDFYPRPPRGGRQHSISESGSRYEFLSTPSARRATLSNMAKILRMLLFLSTPSARRATRVWLTITKERGISIHALREEGDLHGDSDKSMQGYFYPRPPRGGRPKVPNLSQAWMKISIHALREEGDHPA